MQCRRIILRKQNGVVAPHHPLRAESPGQGQEGMEDLAFFGKILFQFRTVAGQSEEEIKRNINLIKAALDKSRKQKFGAISKSEVEKACNFKKSRPFFNNIFSDFKGNLYVSRLKSVLSKEKSTELDLYNVEGYYLYKVKIPFSEFEGVIKDGYIYKTKFDKEGEYFQVKRYKIKNWDQLKEYKPSS